MRYHEISEAPIADLSIVNPTGDKLPMDFTQADKGILNNSKGVKKIINAFEKTPFVFNIFVLMVEGAYGDIVDSKGYHSVTKSKLEKYLGKEVLTDGRITCVYLNNVSGRHKMPMNAWTIAHRMIHMLQTHSDKDTSMYFERVCWDHLVKIARSTTSIAARLNGSGLSMASPEYPLMSLSTLLLTMKSARDNQLTISLDVCGELLAQYLLTGKIKLASWNTVKQRFANKDAIHMRDSSNFQLNQDIDDTVAQQLIQEAEDAMNAAAEVQLKKLVGHIISF